MWSGRRHFLCGHGDHGDDGYKENQALHVCIVLSRRGPNRSCHRPTRAHRGHAVTRAIVKGGRAASASLMPTSRFIGGGVRVPGGLRRLQSGWDERSSSGGFDSRPPPPTTCPNAPTVAAWSGLTTCIPADSTTISKRRVRQANFAPPDDAGRESRSLCEIQAPRRHSFLAH